MAIADNPLQELDMSQPFNIEEFTSQLKTSSREMNETFIPEPLIFAKLIENSEVKNLLESKGIDTEKVKRGLAAEHENDELRPLKISQSLDEEVVIPRSLVVATKKLNIDSAMEGKEITATDTLKAMLSETKLYALEKENVTEQNLFPEATQEVSHTSRVFSR